VIDAPAGYSVRPFTRDDAPAVADLINAFDRAYLEDPDIVDAIEVAGWWRQSELATDSLAFVDAKGELGAIGVVYPRGEDVLDLDGFVSPAHQGRGLGSALVVWLEGEARRRGHPLVQAAAIAADSAAADLLAARSFELIRHFYRMVIDLESPPPAPVWPDGFDVSTLVPGEEPAIRDVIEDAFRDHWGHEPSGLDQWETKTFGQDWWDPSLVYLVRHDGEVVAGEINAVRFGIGWIGSLGTRSAWRGKGLGRALLLHAFDELYRRGQTRIGLAVDAGNETGATHLYESVGMRVVWQSDVWEKRL